MGKRARGKSPRAAGRSKSPKAVAVQKSARDGRHTTKINTQDTRAKLKAARSECQSISRALRRKTKGCGNATSSPRIRAATRELARALKRFRKQLLVKHVGDASVAAALRSVIHPYAKKDTLTRWPDMGIVAGPVARFLYGFGERTLRDRDQLTTEAARLLIEMYGRGPAVIAEGCDAFGSNVGYAVRFAGAALGAGDADLAVELVSPYVRIETKQALIAQDDGQFPYVTALPDARAAAVLHKAYTSLKDVRAASDLTEAVTRAWKATADIQSCRDYTRLTASQPASPTRAHADAESLTRRCPSNKGVPLLKVIEAALQPPTGPMGTAGPDIADKASKIKRQAARSSAMASCITSRGGNGKAALYDAIFTLHALHFELVLISKDQLQAGLKFFGDDAPKMGGASEAPPKGTSLDLKKP